MTASRRLGMVRQDCTASRVSPPASRARWRGQHLDDQQRVLDHPRTRRAAGDGNVGDADVARRAGVRLNSCFNRKPAMGALRAEMKPDRDHQFRLQACLTRAGRSHRHRLAVDQRVQSVYAVARPFQERAGIHRQGRTQGGTHDAG